MNRARTNQTYPIGEDVEGYNLRENADIVACKVALGLLPVVAMRYLFFPITSGNNIQDATNLGLSALVAFSTLMPYTVHLGGVIGTKSANELRMKRTSKSVETLVEGVQ